MLDFFWFIKRILKLKLRCAVKRFNFAKFNTVLHLKAIGTSHLTRIFAWPRAVFSQNIQTTPTVTS